MNTLKPALSLYDVGNYVVALDDDPTSPLLLKRYLNLNVVPFSSLDTLIANAPTLSPRAAFIDIYLGETQRGIDAIPQLRQLWPDTAIFVITSEPSGIHVRDALASGADDFIVKPLNSTELLARFQHRVKEKIDTSGLHQLKFEDLTLELSTFEVSGDRGAHSLSRLTCSLLKALMEASETVLPKETLRRRVWGKVMVSDNSIEKRVSEVRAILKQCSSRVCLEAVYGNGYQLKKIVSDT